MIYAVKEDANNTNRWRIPSITVVICLLSLVWIYKSTIWAMVTVWQNTEIFTHGSLIFPISGYLIWRRRKRLATLCPKPDFWPLIGILLIGLPWIIAKLVDIQVGQQFVFIIQIILTVWAVLGLAVVREIAFPLAFLFFSVPFGEFLIPYLTQQTADFTVSLIQATGIPIFRDGNTFSLPTGEWSVVEACSGIRYLIASLTLGFLYAYLTYRSVWRRLAFIVLSVVFPVIANSLRAFMIVMIGHFSGMKLAVGVDHLIYGWLFFGLVMLVMFWIGSLWSDHATDDLDHAVTADNGINPPNNRLFIIVGFLAFLSAAIWPIFSIYIEREASVLHKMPELRVPTATDGWHLQENRISEWHPAYIGATTEISATYSGVDGPPVGLNLIYYRNQKQGSELISGENVMVKDIEETWQLLDTKKVNTAVENQKIQVNQFRLGSKGKKLLVWEWFWVSGHLTSNKFVAKLLEAKAKLLGQNTDAAAVIVYVEYQESTLDASRLLHRFAKTMTVSIKASLQLAADSK